MSRPEEGLQGYVADRLRWDGVPGLIWYHPANEGKRSPRTGARLKRLGMRPGVADMAIVLPGGRACFLESVTDRCTKAHEYLFLLSKSERYFFDAAAIAEPVAPSTVERLSQSTLDQQAWSSRVPGKTNGPMKAVPPRFGGNKYGDNTSELHRTKSGAAYEIKDGKRNRRSVWTVATRPFKDAHFATFPPALVEPCILAGCPVGGTVLDPFGGAGTTGLVSDWLGRNAILVELNPDYAAMAERRIRNDAGLLAEVAS